MRVVANVFYFFLLITNINIELNSPASLNAALTPLIPHSVATRTSIARAQGRPLRRRHPRRHQEMKAAKETKRKDPREGRDLDRAL